MANVCFELIYPIRNLEYPFKNIVRAFEKSKKEITVERTPPPRLLILQNCYCSTEAWHNIPIVVGNDPAPT